MSRRSGIRFADNRHEWSSIRPLQRFPREDAWSVIHYGWEALQGANSLPCCGQFNGGGCVAPCASCSACRDRVWLRAAASIGHWPHWIVDIDDVYPSLPEDMMQVAKWGNSLAVRLPAAVVEALKLKEGDEIEIHVLEEREIAVARKPGREELLKRLRAFRGRLPPDFKFDRDEANAR